MRLVASVTLLAFVVACAHAPAAPTPLVPEMPKNRVEENPLPPDPATETLPEGTPKGDWTDSQEKGQCFDANGKLNPDAPKPCPDYAGILVSEEHAVRDGLYRLRYKEMRQTYVADRKVWVAQREMYEWMLSNQKDQILKLQPNWWDLHKGEVCFIGGFILGGIMIVGAVHAMPR